MATSIAFAVPAAALVAIPATGSTIVTFIEPASAIATVICQHRGQIEVSTARREAAQILA